jgi:hypothetical protein
MIRSDGDETGYRGKDPPNRNPMRAEGLPYDDHRNDGQREADVPETNVHLLAGGDAGFSVLQALRVIFGRRHGFNCSRLVADCGRALIRAPAH